jgi:hypothetical protein
MISLSLIRKDLALMHNRSLYPFSISKTYTHASNDGVSERHCEEAISV